MIFFTNPRTDAILWWCALTLTLLFLVWAVSGCLPLALYNYATKNIECEAIQADRARGVQTTTPWKDDCVNPH